MKLIKIIFVIILIPLYLDAGIFDLIKDIFSSPPKQIQEPVQKQENTNTMQESVLDENNEEITEEEYIEKVPFRRYPSVYKIAFLLPSNIGKYSSTTLNSAVSYLIRREINFDIKTYRIYNESFESIDRVLQNIGQRNYDLIIAPVTKKTAQNICYLDIQKLIYIPTINKNSIECQNPNIYFGGIDYQKQFGKLAKKTKNHSAVIINDDSLLVRTLNNDAQMYFLPKAFINIKNRKNLKWVILKNRKLLNNSNIILNIPLVKSALFLSQLSLYSVKPKNVLSTQINYDPKIFTLTQYSSRKKMMLANSIYKTYLKYSDAAEILNADVRFDKVDYATMNGLDYFFVKSYPDRGRIFKESFYNNSLEYTTEIVKPSVGEFVRVY